MHPEAELEPPFVARAVASALRAANHGTTAWIAGITLSLVIGPCVGLSSALGGAFRTEPEFPYGARWGIVLASLSIATVVLVVVALTRRANATIARDVRRMLSEGAHHQGRIAQARRVSMTQSKVIVQGTTFPPFERMMSTSLPDAVLLGMVVDVYTHPELSALLLLPDA